MKNTFIKIFLKLLFSSVVLAGDVTGKTQAPIAGEEFLFVFSPVELLNKNLSYEYGMGSCMYVRPSFDLFHRDLEFDLSKLDFTFGIFAEYKINDVVNLFLDYDLIRDESFDYMLFGVKYSF